MARPRKGVVPPQLRRYLFKRRSQSKRGTSMAKRRRFTRVRAVARRVRRRTNSFLGRLGSSSKLMEIGFSFGYGYVRGWLINNPTTQSIMAMVPFGGQYKDNIFLGLGAYLVGWLLKPSGYVKEMLDTVIRSEAFIAGAKMQSGATLTASSTSSYAGVVLN